MFSYVLNILFLIGLMGEEVYSDWGFYSHRKINRTAVFTLPPEMIGYYKQHIQYITEKAVNPDMRRYIDPEEGPRHYIDLEYYGDSALYKIPKYYTQAVDQYSEDSLKSWGIVPWHIEKLKNYLTKAFLHKEGHQILRLSVDLGHYIADVNVPLHTTVNYNGQLTDQYGIHGFWESRLPELFSDSYNLFTGRAEYLPDTQKEIWDAVHRSNSALDSVLLFEKKLTKKFDPSEKYSFEDRNGRTVKVYSYDFSNRYHRMLNGMVENQMRHAIKMIGDFWYTCWVDGGQPDLETIRDQLIQDEKEKFSSGEVKKTRKHE